MALAPKGYTAFGTTVTGTDSAGTIKVAGTFTGVIVRLGDLTQSREKVEKTNSVSSGGAAEYVPGDIIEGHDYEIDILHDTQVSPPFGEPEVIEIAHKLRGTEATKAKKTFTGFLIEYGTSMPLRGTQGMIRV